jgi:two-component system response regulator HydG/two-component system response regulator AtoC
MQYDWPGNVRELRNVMEAAIVMADGSRVLWTDMPEAFRRACESLQYCARDEKEMLLSALHAARWNKTKAAHKLNWSRMTLYRKMREYKLSSSTGEAPATKSVTARVGE